MGERLVLVPYLKLNGTKVAQLNYENIIKYIFYKTIGITGAPGRSRTCDPQYRKLMLYPAELRVHLVGVVCVEDSRTNGLNYAAS